MSTWTKIEGKASIPRDAKFSMKAHINEFFKEYDYTLSIDHEQFNKIHHNMTFTVRVSIDGMQSAKLIERFSLSAPHLTELWGEIQYI